MGTSGLKNRLSFGMALAFITVSAFPAAVIAQEAFTVTRGDDPIPAQEGTLRWAVQQANATPGMDTVVIDGAAIGFSDRGEFVREAVIELGDRIEITDALAIDDLSQVLNDRIRIVGSGQSRVFSFIPGEQDSEATLTLESLDIVGGNTQAPGNPESCGSDAGQGGAICAQGDVELRHSTISASTTSGENAGGGAIWSSGRVTLLASRIFDSQTSGSGAFGGAISAQEVSCLQSIVENNQTQADFALGGGIHATDRTFGRLCRVSGNATAGALAHGGGIATGDLRTFSDRPGFTISGNSTQGSEGRGGGAFVNHLDISLSTFSDNNGGRGDALYVQSDGSSEDPFSISGSTFVGKQSTAIILDSRTSENPAGFSIQIVNSTILVNSDGTFPTVFVPAVEVDDTEARPVQVNQSNNFPTDLTGDTFTGRTLSDLESPDYCYLGLGEFLAALTLGGECMSGHVPLPDSSLVDQAEAEFFPAATSWDGRDRGFDRIVGDAPDIGALESSRVIRYFVAESFTLGEAFLTEFVAESGAVCSGSGLPGTEWNGEPFVASGVLEFPFIDTAGLDLEQLGLTVEELPSEVTVGITCNLDGVETSLQEDRTREVTIFPPEEDPPAELDIQGMPLDMAVAGARFVVLDVSNVGQEDADEVQLDVLPPENHEVLNAYRLAPSCGVSPAGSGEVRCDVATIPDWQCTVSSGVSCVLDQLPVGGAAAVVIEIEGSGPSLLTGSVSAANAAEATTQVDINN